MATTKTTTQETVKPVVFGDSSIGVGGTTQDSSTQDSSTSADASIAMGDAQAKQFITTTVVNNGKIPQVDSASYKERARHLTNGDIRTEDGSTSVFATKMVNEAKAFQLSKPIINSFPADGSTYLSTLDFKVNQ